MRCLVMLVSLLFFLASGTAGSGTGVPLKVMSFNIWKGGTDFEAVVAAIRTGGADIVGLQEAPNSRRIATRLGFFHDPQTRILSRYPVIASLDGGAGTVVRLPNGRPLYVFNVHLTAYPYAPYCLPDTAAALRVERKTQYLSLLPRLDAIRPFIKKGELCILVGDFNTPSHLDYKDVPWLCSRTCLDAGLHDTYRIMHPARRRYPPGFRHDDAGITWTPRHDQEPHGVFDRIDFVYYSGRTNDIIASAAVGNGTNWPSDHRAVITSLVIPDGKTVPLPRLLCDMVVCPRNAPLTFRHEGTGPGLKYWIGLYPKGAVHGPGKGSLVCQFTDIGDKAVIFPAGLAKPGEYEARLFFGDGYLLLATVAFSVR